MAKAEIQTPFSVSGGTLGIFPKLLSLLTNLSEYSYCKRNSGAFCLNREARGSFHSSWPTPMMGDRHVCPVLGTTEEAHRVLSGVAVPRGEGPGSLFRAVPPVLGATAHWPSTAGPMLPGLLDFLPALPHFTAGSWPFPQASVKAPPCPASRQGPWVLPLCSLHCR